MKRLLVFQVLILFICAAVYLPALCKERVVKEHETIGNQEYQSPGLNPKASQQNNEPTVYYTRSGRRYHRRDCSHIIGRNPTGIALSRAKQMGLTPCKTCKPPE